MCVPSVVLTMFFNSNIQKLLGNRLTPTNWYRVLRIYYYLSTSYFASIIGLKFNYIILNGKYS